MTKTKTKFDLDRDIFLKLMKRSCQLGMTPSGYVNHLVEQDVAAQVLRDHWLARTAGKIPSPGAAVAGRGKSARKRSARNL